MQCPACGNIWKEGYTHCAYCGTALRPILRTDREPEQKTTRRCTGCNRSLPHYYRFCDFCGTPVPEEQKNKFNWAAVSASAPTARPERPAPEPKKAEEPKVITVPAAAPESEKVEEIREEPCRPERPEIVRLPEEPEEVIAAEEEADEVCQPAEVPEIEYSEEIAEEDYSEDDEDYSEDDEDYSEDDEDYSEDDEDYSEDDEDYSEDDEDYPEDDEDYSEDDEDYPEDDEDYSEDDEDYSEDDEDYSEDDEDYSEDDEDYSEDDEDYSEDDEDYSEDDEDYSEEESPDGSTRVFDMGAVNANVHLCDYDEFARQTDRKIGIHNPREGRSDNYDEKADRRRNGGGARFVLAWLLGLIALMLSVAVPVYSQGAGLLPETYGSLLTKSTELIHSQTMPDGWFLAYTAATLLPALLLVIMAACRKRVSCMLCSELGLLLPLAIWLVNVATRQTKLVSISDSSLQIGFFAILLIHIIVLTILASGRKRTR